MKKISLLLVLLSACFISNAQPLTAEQQTIRKVFFDFLKFYKKNEAKFNSFRLYKGQGKENNPPFTLQWKEAERYFAWLRASVPYVGEAYIKAERERFRFSDSCFKADPEDELPAGFDYDRWAGGQESIEYTLPRYTSSKNKYQVTINGNTALLRIGMPIGENATDAELSWSVVPFVKEKGKWKMADNVYPETEEEGGETD